MAPMTYTEAADRIKQLAFYYQGVLELAEALSTAGSLEATIAGLRTQRAEEERSLDACRAEHAAITAQTVRASADADRLVRTAEQQTRAVQEKARHEADRIQAAAAQDAERQTNEERARREERLADLTREVVQTQQTLATLQAEIAETTAQRQRAEDLLAQTRAELDDIQTRARKMLGSEN